MCGNVSVTESPAERKSVFDPNRYFNPKRPKEEKFFPGDAIDKCKDLTDAERRLAQRLMRFYDPAKGYAWPSHQELADALGKGERTVRRYLVALESKGIIEWDWRGRSPKTRKRLSNSYRFLRHPLYPEGSPGWAAEATIPEHKTKQSAAHFKRPTGDVSPGFKRPTGALLNGHLLAGEQSVEQSSSEKQESRASSPEKSPVAVERPEPESDRAFLYGLMMIPEPAAERVNPETETGTFEERFAARLERRHGKNRLVDREQILRDVRSELGSVPFDEFLDLDAAATTGRLKNPHGHYRALAKKLANKYVAKVHETMMAVRRAQTVTPATGKCTLCGGGKLPDGNYCECRLGADLKRIESRVPRPAAVVSAQVAA